jgi:hypothetical protein
MALFSLGLVVGNNYILGQTLNVFKLLFDEDVELPAVCSVSRK